MRAAAPVWEILTGDCVEQMQRMADASVDVVCTDPPYGIGFMGHAWDQPGLEMGKREGIPSGQRRASNPATSGFDLEGGAGAKEAGRYDLSRTANQAFQAWCERWAREAHRVLKPGGFILAFGGTRTVHRLMSGLEDAGFEIRDALAWMQAAGFPKSLNVSKAIDRAAGADREAVGEYAEHDIRRPEGGGGERLMTSRGNRETTTVQVTAPATPDAVRWEGWGTALKPAYEPIVVARKPLIGTVVENVLAHGTGAINVAACRIGTDGGTTRSHQADFQHEARKGTVHGTRGYRTGHEIVPISGGRWPANVVLTHHAECVPVGTATIQSDGHYPAARGAGSVTSGPAGHTGQDDLEEAYTAGEEVMVWACVQGCPIRALDDQTGTLRSGAGSNFIRESGGDRNGNRSAAFGAENRKAGDRMIVYGDQGGASRFYYCSKASTAERHMMDVQALPRARSARKRYQQDRSGRWRDRVANRHPTVKPIDLMRWLVRLACPPGGLVLDPFAGSGTTGCAAALEGFRFVGIERDKGSVVIAKARIGWWAKQPPGITKHILRPRAQPVAPPVPEGQLDLLALMADA